MYTIDFETHPIVDHRAPKPVGLAIRDPDGQTSYLTTLAGMRAYLAPLWDKAPLLAHNMRFELGVCIEHLGLPLPENPLLFHDSMLDAWLSGAPKVGLKDLCPRARRAEEAMHAWMDEHMAPVGKQRSIRYGERIWEVPTEVAREYAIQDVVSAFELPQNWHGTQVYQRYQRLLPRVYVMEMRGVKIDDEGLNRYRNSAELRLHKLQAATGIPESILSSPPRLLKDLLRAGLVDPDLLLQTPKGKLSASAESLAGAMTDPDLAHAIDEWRRSRKEHTAFIVPWAEQLTNHRLNARYRYINASRTGRMACSKPNMQQVPKALRRFILPAEGESWVSIDYSQQELRILAHLTDGRMAQIYRANPSADLHQEVATAVRCTRKQAKAVNFGIIYGQGIAALAQSLDLPYHEAAELKQGYFKRFPEVEKWIRQISSHDIALTTGGRRVYVEKIKRSVQPPPGWSGFTEGEVEDALHYKMPNKVIQGSGADMIIEAMLSIDSHVVVHDEINISTDCPFEVIGAQKAMVAASPLSVPMIVDTTIGDNWGECQ